jgi:hypothetical protein
MGVRVRIVASVLLLSLLTLPLIALAQRFFLPSADRSLPTVEYNSHFAFTRIRYGARIGFAFGGWEHDYPAADRNFSAILDYITNMRVHLDGSNILDLDDPRIFENPVIYMSEPGNWTTDDAEAANLRAYLLKGGFIIFDDFEGDFDWQNLVSQMKQALPEHHFIRLDVTHPIFQSFFGLKTLNIPHPMSPSLEPVFLGLFEDNDPSSRMLAIANWNNDIGDYWEWSAEGLYGDAPTNDAYRLGVNYLVYEMTH